MPSLGDHVLSSSSCLIHCAKEAECAAELDLEFMWRQAKVSLSEKIELLIFYNVTALDSVSLTLNERLVERDDVTNSLIYKQMKLPTVTIFRRPDTETVTLLTDVHGFPILQLDVPGISSSNFFDLQILQTAELPLKKLKMHLLFSSELRFLWAEEQDRVWRLQVRPTPQGVTVRLRLRGSPNTDSSEAAVDETADFPPSYYVPHVAEADMSTPRHQKAVPIGFLRFERVGQHTTNFDRAQALGGSPVTAYSSEEDDEVDSGSRRPTDYAVAPEPGFITVNLSQVDWLKSPTSENTSAPALSESPLSGTTVRLHIPAAPPDPSDMFIFVQFQVRLRLIVLYSPLYFSVFRLQSQTPATALVPSQECPAPSLLP
ncbi:unnamed protein product [Schistocephalus solidus]|uniref:DUF5735 domain-containing protein n=1 Tax=Schistocephalus solidus TaxID=70667 RepID=A0A183SUU1_SCHSO|nr:unnamed protein product [Schistocephalus solidus]